MGSRWQKAKMALSSHLCAYVPRTLDDTSSSSAAESVPAGRISGSRLAMEPDFRPSTPTPSSSGLRLSKSSGKSSKRFCAICLGTMRPGHGHALFTAECSHIFHFHCIASNVKHGNQVCPICRSKWKEIPFQGPTADVVHGRSRINPLDCPQEEGWMRILHGMPLPRASPDSGQQHNPVFHASEPNTFNDDEPLDSSLSELLGRDYTESTEGLTKTVEMKTYAEFPAVLASENCDSFTVLIHLKAPSATSRQGQRNHRSVFQSHHERAPVDLVTVLDVSGSMAGTKLALLKRAMGFVIQNLGPSDRLSVVAFSSTARRLFHLRRMTDSGRQLALQAVNSLTSSGGTNIAEGLRKGSNILEDRREKNPVCSIILLSDGQDTYNIAGGSQSRQGPADYQSLLPVSIRRSSQQGQAQVPVHTFGFGADHDAASMHSISESSGGTFSFIEAENVIQDAFAQCIGGLLSVVVQELQVWFECTTPGVIINSVRSGSYASGVSEDRKKGNVDVGDLYAEEERDFLVDVQMPACCTTISTMQNEFEVLGVGCVYKDPVLQEHVNLDVNKVVIQRPRTISPQQKIACLEVDRQKMRVKAADAMSEARGLAEQGNLAGAVCVLGNQRKALSESMAAQGEDRLCIALDAELKEMQDRMASRQVYEASGRAYVLSGLSSHSWQRATARGDSTDSGSSVHGYQTPSMVDMLMRSHTSFISSGGQRSRPTRPPIKPSRSCRGTLQAR
ncbi:E3 ubiquitin-protein ligase WAV3-like [Nymphaea colorata]|nr:E3 ubiquitin-protein ligase WAV3-like [Nymphaea colorata]